GVDIAGNSLQRGKPALGVGTWSSTTAYPAPRAGHTSVACNGFLYVLGGANNNPDTGKLNDVQFASINASGAVDNDWTPTSSFTTPRDGHASVAYNGYLYVLGGASSGGYLNDVQYAPIRSD